MKKYIFLLLLVVVMGLAYLVGCAWLDEVEA